MIRLRRSMSSFSCLFALLAPLSSWAQEPEKPPPPADAEEATMDPPKLLQQPRLELAEGAARVFVELELVVRASGRADSAEVVEAGDEALDQRALDAVAGLRFEPARRGDEAVDVRIRYRMLFVPPADDPRSPDAPSPDAPSTEPDAEPIADPPSEPPPKGPSSAVEDAAAEDESYSATAEVRRPHREATRYTLEGEELKRVPGTRGDPLRAIEVMPGVGRTSLNDGAPRLRGSASTDSITLLGGEIAPQLYHFGGVTSVIHPSLLSRVDLYPGNFSARYGRIGGGVVSASLRDPRTDGFHAVVDANTIDGSVLVEGPLGDRVAVALAGRRSILDAYFGAFVPEDSFNVVAAPVYYDFQGLLTARLHRDHTLRFVGYGSHDSLELFLPDPVDGEPSLAGDVSAQIAFYRARLSLESRLSDSVKQELSASYGLIDGVSKIGTTDATFKQHQISSRAEWTAALHPKVSVTVGGDFLGNIVDGDYSGQRPPQTEGDPNIGNADNGLIDIVEVLTTIQPAAYVELSYRPHGDWLLQPGVRVDYYGELGKFSVDPRLVARYRAAPDTTLKAGVGLFSQPPVYWESAPALGNPDLDESRVVQSSLGIEQRLFDRIEINVDGFYKHMLDRVVATDGGVAPFFVNDGAGRIYGVETSIRARPIEGMTAYVAYTISRSERRERGGNFRLFDEDQTHNLATALSYHFGSGWGLGARFRLISGNPQTPVTGSVFNANVAQYTPLFGATNSRRSSLFHQLDLNAEKKWTFESWSLTAYIAVLNVYNHEVEEGRSYSYDYRQSEPILGLPLLPSLGLRGEL